MAKPTPPDQRQFMSPYLSDLPGIKLFVQCKLCGLAYQFDGAAMLERIDEDCNLPTLIRKIRLGLKCQRALNAKNYFDPQCQLVYDSEKMDRMNPGVQFRIGAETTKRPGSPTKEPPGE